MLRNCVVYLLIQWRLYRQSTIEIGVLDVVVKVFRFHFVVNECFLLRKKHRPLQICVVNFAALLRFQKMTQFCISSTKNWMIDRMNLQQLV